MPKGQCNTDPVIVFAKKFRRALDEKEKDEIAREWHVRQEGIRKKYFTKRSPENQ